MSTTTPAESIKIGAYSITQSGAIAGLTALAGQAAAFIPNEAAYQQVEVSAGSLLIAAVFMVANALHHRTAAVARVGAPAQQAAVTQALSVAQQADKLRQQVTNAGMTPDA